MLVRGHLVLVRLVREGDVRGGGRDGKGGKRVERQGKSHECDEGGHGHRKRNYESGGAVKQSTIYDGDYFKLPRQLKRGNFTYLANVHRPHPIPSSSS